MDALTEPPNTVAPKAWTAGDTGFIVFIAFVLVAVTWLGVVARNQALKTEGTKRNGEQWAAWLTKESAKRFEPGYALSACAGGTKAAAAAPAAAEPASEAAAASTDAPPASTAPAVASANTWGACLEQLTTQTEFKDMVNPFTGKPPVFIPACDPSDNSLVGSIVFDKVTPNPPGSAIASVTSQLMATDLIAEKVQLKIAVCDKGSYAVKIAELEF
ncbi:MAG: hypothetical protein QE283_03985 [Rhodoferax sp.]|nr:hypothetical protein [Rhodoferax sp.]